MNGREAYLIGRAVVRTMLDSERTEEIHLVEELTGRGYYHRFMEATAGDPAVRELLADRPELRSDQVDFDALRALPADTFGGAYVRHLDDNGLSADYQAAPIRHIEDEDMAYLMRRFRQTHDVWHALTGLGTSEHDEVVIHAFSWGQLRLPVSKMVVLLGSLKLLVVDPRRRALGRDLWDAYRVGRDAAPLLPVYWERYWDEPLDSIRSRYGIDRTWNAGHG